MGDTWGRECRHTRLCAKAWSSICLARHALDRRYFSGGIGVGYLIINQTSPKLRLLMTGEGSRITTSPAGTRQRLNDENDRDNKF